MEGKEGLDFRHYAVIVWRVLKRRRWMALALFLAVALPTAVVIMQMEPRYESAGTVWVEEQNVPVFQDLTQRGRLPVLLTILQSRSLAVSVVDALPRKAYDELLRNRYESDWTEPFTNFARRLRGRPVAAVSPREQVISELLKARMTFRPQPRTGIVTVTATASDPAIATDIATAYIETLQSKTRFFTREESRAVRELLDNQAKHVGEALRQAEEALVQFQNQRGALKLDSRIHESFEGMRQAEGARSASILSEDIARTRLAAVKAQLEGRQGGKKVTESLSTPSALRNLFERWSRAETALASLTRRYTEAHPQVRAAREEAQQVWPRLDEALRQYLRITTSTNLPPLERAPLIDQAISLAEEIERLPADREAAEAKARTLRSSVGTLSHDQLEFARRQQAVETQKALYLLLTQKAEQANIRSQEELRHIRVLDPPSVPTSPISGRAMKILLMGLVAGLGLAVGVPMGLEMLDSTIKTEEEVETLLGWPVLGTVQAMEVRPALANGTRASRALPPGTAGRKERA